MSAYKPVLERLESRLDKSSDCWTWTGAVRDTGYGAIGIAGNRVAQVHRVAYEQFVRPIPAGLHIDHLCRNRLCCNPEHLEPVTQAENNRRAAQVRRKNKTHCQYGHEFSGENLIEDPRGGRQCRTCRNWTRRAQRRGLNLAAYVAGIEGAL